MFSFDVFDTLITRKMATPYGIFALIQHKLNTFQEYQGISSYISENFYELRIHSEELVRENNRFKEIEEVTLEEIYAGMAITGCLSLDEQKLLCQLERMIEIENVTGIEENIIKIKNLKAQGEEIILISDMYLDKKTVRQMLVKVDDVFTDIPIYISSECCKRKVSGNLYRTIKEQMKIDYSDWTHCGDNLNQDIEIPYSLGISVQNYIPEPLTNFEENLLYQYGNHVQLQLMIGAAKNARRQNKLVSNAERIGCTFSGPILFCYTKWILEQCKRKGIKRLYFIARDGYLIKRIADILIVSDKLDIDTFYIYGSRKAWRIPSLSREHFNLYQIIQWSYLNKIKTISDLAEVLMIPEKEIYKFLPFDCNTNFQFSSQSLTYIVKKLERNIEFQEYLLEKNAHKRKLVMDYLCQEINMSDDNFAFVEVAGGGLTQGCLWNLIREFYNKPIRTFFFKIDRINLMDNCINDTFLPCFIKNNLVIEMICRAPHGQTESYEVKEGRIIPVLEGIEGEALIKNGFFEYQKGIECYVKQMVEFYNENYETKDFLAIVLKYLNYIAREPDQTVLEFFASFPNSESGREKQLVEYAPKLSKEDMDNIFLKRRSTECIEDYYKGSNLEYSLLRCSKEELAYIEQCKKDYHLARGILARQEKENDEKKMKKLYGIAWKFPCEVLEEKIVLYGAGKFGQALYNKIKAMGKSDVVQWVDQDYKKCNQKDLGKVESPDMLGAKEFNQLVIAVINEELAKSIEKDLIRRGIPNEKIVWF